MDCGRQLPKSTRGQISYFNYVLEICPRRTLPTLLITWKTQLLTLSLSRPSSYRGKQLAQLDYIARIKGIHNIIQQLMQRAKLLLRMPLSKLPPPIQPPVKYTLGADFTAPIARLAAAALRQVKPSQPKSNQRVFHYESEARTFDLRALQAVQAFERFVRFGRGPADRRGSSGWTVEGARRRRDRGGGCDVMLCLLLDGQQGRLKESGRIAG